MKKLLILSLVAFFALGSAKVFAQTDDGATPFAGSTHTYYVNGTWTDGNSDGAIQPAELTNTGNSGDTYTWWVSTDETDLTQQEAAGTYFTVSNGTYGTGSSTGGANSISLTWTAAAVAAYNGATPTNFFVVVQEEDATTGCSNLKAFQVKPANNFDLAFVNMKPDLSGVGADNQDQCPQNVAVSFNSGAIDYGYGVSYMYYRLTTTGITNTAWQFDYQFTTENGLTGSNVTVDYGTVSGGTYTKVGDLTNATGAAATSPSIAAGSNEIYVRVTITNNKLSDGTYNEGTSAQNVALTLTNVQDAGGNPVQNINSAGTTDDVKAQVVNARPGTSTIGHD
ncbi:hypothetical protein PbJCM13498_14010 [Prolixibacter bellariivorans]|uniref:Uncharacterized protein n=1 Tax=Prolixibacter bellariivorans TaxID=314319 RepID=A0A5M4AXY1_9BACT|nr:hypothetical protein [Prolixibacter bellariivorans]GET32538.1 hypothetical protein PbJCM13498_14010 [Prolixibacter bellariivorans]